jgi:hypothetical protein
MRKTRPDLPLWAKILFESPELLSEIIDAISIQITRSKLKIAHYLIKHSRRHQ